jgi:MtN3 and saliva related transmembrane protein
MEFEVVDILGYIASILIAFCYVPQILKIIANKNGEMVSYVMYFILILANILFIYYGIIKNVIPIILTNVIGFFMCCMIICLKIYYSKNTITESILN